MVCRQHRAASGWQGLGPLGFGENSRKPWKTPAATRDRAKQAAAATALHPGTGLWPWLPARRGPAATVLHPVRPAEHRAGPG